MIKTFFCVLRRRCGCCCLMIYFEYKFFQYEYKKLTFTAQPHQKIRFLEFFFRILNMLAIVINLQKKKN